MKNAVSLILFTAIGLAFTMPANANSPDCYVVNFKNSNDSNSQKLEPLLQSAMKLSGVNLEEVIIDDCPSSYKMARISVRAKRDFAHLFG